MFQRVRGVGSASLPRLALFPNAALPSAMLARARARTALLGLGPTSVIVTRDRYRLNHYRHRCLLLRAMQEHDLRQISYTLSRRQFRP
jgi:hypothetical protein